MDRDGPVDLRIDPDDGRPRVSLEVLAGNALWVAGLMTGLWTVSVVKRDASIVDPWWSIAFLLVAVHTVSQSGLTPAKALLLMMVAGWALRLWLHLLSRNWGESEDPRYRAFREHFGPDRYWWISFFQVFCLQGLLVLIISAPIQLALARSVPDPISWADVAGASIFLVGFGMEVVSDQQLRNFRRDPARKGQVLDHGLWRFSRHPNYFGEALLWWGFWFCVADQEFGWITAFAPILMTFLLVKVSGVAMLDQHLMNTKPGYRSYVEKTSAFVPRRPRG